MDEFEELENAFAEADLELQGLLQKLLYGSGADKYRTYQTILFLLASLKNKVSKNSLNLIKSIYNKEMQSNFPVEVLQSQDFKAQTNLDIYSLNYELNQALSKALSNIYMTAAAFSVSNRLEDAAKYGIDPANASSVSVIGVNGRAFNFKLSYYTSLVLNHIRSKAETLSVINTTEKNGKDLVIVSPQASMHGDYCDAYTNAVFSLSGRDEFFPPLALTPNQGTPFHPHCRHTISPYDSSVHRNIRRVEKQFLSSNVKDVAKAWWAKKKQ